MVQILEAVKYIHDSQLLHRDIKTENVFLDSKMNTKLGDFGTAKIKQISGQNSLEGIYRSFLIEDVESAEENFMGTPLFSSPEILTKNEFSEKSDAWAVGVILYHLCCLKLPFSEKSYRRMIEAIKTKSPGPIPPQYSTHLQTIISRLLDKNPKTRASVHDILEIPFVKGLREKTKKSTFKAQKERSCDFKISQKSLKNDFENLRIFKNSNFMTKDIIEKLEKERNWGSDSESNMLEMNESMVIENKNDSTMGKQLCNEDINWLRERMSVAGSIKASIKKLHTNFDVKQMHTESDK